MMVVTMLLVSGIAAGQDAPEPDAEPGLLSNVTLSCSASAPTWLLGCYVERPVLVLGALELAVGLDAQAVLTGAHEADFAAYGTIGIYEETWSAWVEFWLPELAPALGSPDWFRIGFTYRFGEPEPP